MVFFFAQVAKNPPKNGTGGFFWYAFLVMRKGLQEG